MRTHRFLMIALLLALGVLTAVPSRPAVADDINSTRGFRKAVTLEGVREHLVALQAIADAHNGIRASGLPGYDEAAQYVSDRLATAGYSPQQQEFEFFFFQKFETGGLFQISPTPKSYETGTYFFSASGDVYATVQPVDVKVPPTPTPTSTSGCEAADFANFTPGNIALIQRGTCNYRVKAENAVAAGAAAVIFFNEGQPGRTGIALGSLAGPGISIPIVGANYADGAELYNLSLSGPHVVRIKTNTVNDYRLTSNIIAETPSGDPNHIILVGARLDTFAATPGITDNGSGVATILEIAEVLAAQQRETRNKIRFVFFGADELVLQGSTHYINSLSQAERDKIELYLDFESLSSPNFARFIYDGNNSTFPAGPGAVPGPAGSGEIERVFADYFASQNLAADPIPFSPRSSYSSFSAAGIPVGNIFGGSDGIKSAQQAAVYGGTAGAPFNACYRVECDTLSNVNNNALDQMSDAAAHAVLIFGKRNFNKQPLTQTP